MKVYLFERGKSEIAQLCEKAIMQAEFELCSCPQGCDIGIAPWLNRLIPLTELAEFKLGVLVFHPSLLPAYRGKSAIKDAFSNLETHSGATWFWANQDFDKGDICEQSILPINHATPREFYEIQVVPMAVRLLVYILNNLKNGIVRRTPQHG